MNRIEVSLQVEKCQLEDKIFNTCCNDGMLAACSRQMICYIKNAIAEC